MGCTILDDTPRDDVLASTTTACNWASWPGGMTIGSRPRAANSRVSFRRYRRSFTNSLASRTKSRRLRKTRIRTSACGSSTSNCWLGISSWRSWLDLVTGAMSRAGRDPELGADFIINLSSSRWSTVVLQLLPSSCSLSCNSKQSSLVYRRRCSHKRSLEDEEAEGLA